MCKWTFNSKWMTHNKNWKSFCQAFRKSNECICVMALANEIACLSSFLSQRSVALCGPCFFSKKYMHRNILGKQRDYFTAAMSISHTCVHSFMLAIQQSSSASPHSFTTFLSLIHNFSLSHFKMPNNSITAPVNEWPAHSKTGKLEITPFSHLFIIFTVTNIRLYWHVQKRIIRRFCMNPTKSVEQFMFYKCVPHL